MHRSVRIISAMRMRGIDGAPWLLRSEKPPGSSQAMSVSQNLGAIGWRLTPEQIAKLDEASATTARYAYWQRRRFRDRNPSSP